MSDFQRITRFLAAVRRRLVWVHLGAGLVAALAGAGIIFLVCALGAAATGPHPLWPTVAASALLLAGLGLFGWLAARPLLGLRRDADVARQVGVRAPGVRSDLISAVELGAELPALEREPRFSRDLVLALAGQTARAVGALDLRGVAPSSPLRRPVGVLFAVGLAYVFLGLGAPGVLRRGALALSRRGPLGAEAADEPIVGDITLTLTYPRYSGRPTKVVPNTSGDISALRGTSVEIRTRALLPARGASLILGDQELRPAEVKGGQVNARLVTDQSSSYRFALALPGGRNVREPLAHKIDLEPDHPPKVELYAPAEDLEVAGPKIVEIGYVAEDDYGLSEVALVWQTGSGAEQRRVLRQTQGGRSIQGRFDWDLAEVGLRPGMRVAYRIEARDNDDVGGPNVGSSRTFYLRLTSAREKHEEKVTQQTELLETVLKALGDRLEAPPGNEDAPAQRALDAIAAAHEAEQAAITLAARISDESKGDAMAPKELRPALSAMAERLGRLVRAEAEPLAEAQGRRRRGLAHVGALGTLREESGKHVGELENDALKLDDLIGRQRLENLSALADEANAAKTRLKQLLEKYRKTRDESVRKELEREMRELAARLREIQQKLTELAARHEVPDEFLNAKVDKNALADVEHLEEMLRRGDLEGAARELDKLSRAIDDMRAALDQDLRGFKDTRFAAEEKALSEMMDKIGDLEQQEKQLSDETKRLLDKQRERANQLMKDRIDAFVKRELEKAARLGRRAQEVPPAPLMPYDQEELERARRRVEDLKKMLDQGDLEQALEMAREAHASLRMALDDAQGEMGRMGLTPRLKQDMSEAQKKLGEAEPLAREIVDDLERAMPRPQDLMNPEERRKMQELGGRQQATRRRLEQLLQEAQERAREAPGIGDAPPALRGAQADMQRAEGELRGERPREAFGREEQAQQKLAELRKQLQRQRRSSPSGAEGQNVALERIKIPGADEFRAPREFRQDILDAMKEAGKAPEPYRGQVKKYYEELVK